MPEKIDIAALKDYDEKTILLLIATTMNSHADQMQGLNEKVKHFIEISEHKVSREEYRAYVEMSRDEREDLKERLRTIEEAHKAHPHDVIHRRLYTMENKWENQSVRKNFFLGLTSGTWKVIAAIIAISGWILALTNNSL